jgi:putative monooxygenase ydhR
MKYLLQVDFPHAGPFKEEFSEAFADLAKDIATDMD